MFLHPVAFICALFICYSTQVLYVDAYALTNEKSINTYDEYNNGSSTEIILEYGCRDLINSCNDNNKPSKD